MSAPVPPMPLSSAPATELRDYFDRPFDRILDDPSLPAALDQVLDGLERGEIRAAVRRSHPGDGGDFNPWAAVPWVKTAVLAAFRSSPTIAMDPRGRAFDRAAFPVRRLSLEDEVRWVPGGSAVRRGAHLAPGVVMMPPSYVNVGAFVGARTMIDSHVLVGSCAQIGADVHLSAGVQVGGVLEPPGAVPVVVEDGAFLGAQCGVFEGVRVGARAVLAPGVQLTASTDLYDLVEETTRRATVPAGAVVVPGSRPAGGAFAEARGLAVYAPVIIKYRDASTDVATALEGALR